ncbi:MAG: translation elongation factor Ts [Spirochaetes bacterium]|nr:translation elongation factor Ts [Spirochaetota bacterium]
MADISAADVKRLRDKTGAGMMDCKKALVEAEGDFEKAEKQLKEKGLAALQKRSGNAADEGKVFVKTKGEVAALVELSCETDFVSRNPDFIDLGEAMAELAIDKNFTEPNDELRGMVNDLATKIREKMDIKRLKLVKAGADEYFTQYIHGDGTIGVVVKCKAGKPEVFKTEEVQAFVFSLALHIAAFNPLALERASVDQSWLKEQEGILRAQMELDEELMKKPPNVLEGIFKGKVNKFLSDICLLEQRYVKDEKLTVKQAIEDCAKKADAGTLEISEFVYYKAGS